MNRLTLIVLLIVAGTTGCKKKKQTEPTTTPSGSATTSGSDTGSSNTGSSAGSSGSSSDSAGSGSETGSAGSGSDTNSGSATGSGSGSAGAGGSGSNATMEVPKLTPKETTVPTKPADLQKWLVAGNYKKWPHETKPHKSSGPHDDGVVVHLSPAIATALNERKPVFPQGAATVKELYKAGKLAGWAVGVKTKPESDRGNNWYWYEVASTAANAKPTYEGVGYQACRECHMDSTHDLVMSGYPLQ